MGTNYNKYADSPCVQSFQTYANFEAQRNNNRYVEKGLIFDFLQDEGNDNYNKKIYDFAEQSILAMDDNGSGDVSVGEFTTRQFTYGMDFSEHSDEELENMMLDTTLQVAFMDKILGDNSGTLSAEEFAKFYSLMDVAYVDEKSGEVKFDTTLLDGKIDLDTYEKFFNDLDKKYSKETNENIMQKQVKPNLPCIKALHEEMGDIYP